MIPAFLLGAGSRLDCGADGSRRDAIAHAYEMSDEQRRRRPLELSAVFSQDATSSASRAAQSGLGGRKPLTYSLAAARDRIAPASTRERSKVFLSSPLWRSLRLSGALLGAAKRLPSGAESEAIRMRRALPRLEARPILAGWLAADWSRVGTTDGAGESQFAAR